MSKTFFTMTQDDYDKLIKACTPVPLIALQCGMPPSQQEMANAAWCELGDRMGFDGMSVEPDRSSKLSFWAVAKDPVTRSEAKAATLALQYGDGKPRNPLLIAEEQVNAIYHIDVKGEIASDAIDLKDSEERDAKADAIWKAAGVTKDPNARRLAIIVLKAAQAKEQSYDTDSGRYKLDETEAAAQFTLDPFEARLVGLALAGWWNDIISGAWAALGIDERHGTTDLKDMEAQAEWWKTTIDGLELSS